MEIVPFTQRFAEPAARLVAAVHATGDDVAAWIPSGPAVAALDAEGALVGVLAASIDGRVGVGVGAGAAAVAKTRLAQHAATGDDARMTYRRMYRALSARLVAVGCFEHAVTVAADRPETLNTFVELGFGFDQIKGLRPLTRPARTSGVFLRTATPADLPRMVELTWELQQFHAAAPMHRPALLDMRALREDLSAAVTDDTRLALLAEHDGSPAGLLIADPDKRIPATATIGIAVVAAAVRGRSLGTALLSGAVDWAIERGYRNVGAGWTSANLVSDAFWRGHGFIPAQYTLTRRVDPRVAWADERLDYRDLNPESRD